jgi:hypothetical protein
LALVSADFWPAAVSDVLCDLVFDFDMAGIVSRREQWDRLPADQVTIDRLETYPTFEQWWGFTLVTILPGCRVISPEPKLNC